MQGWLHLKASHALTPYDVHVQLGKKFKRGPEVQDLPDYARVTHFLATLGFQVRSGLTYCLSLRGAHRLILPAALDVDECSSYRFVLSASCNRA